MAETPAHIKVTVTLEQLFSNTDVYNAIEDAVRQAYLAGFQQGIQPPEKVREKGGVSAAYTDWRGWGPGAALPGGERFRLEVEARERVEDLVPPWPEGSYRRVKAEAEPVYREKTYPVVGGVLQPMETQAGQELRNQG